MTMKAYQSTCRNCGAAILLFDLPVDEQGIGAVKICIKCGAENSMRTQVSDREPVKIAESTEIERLVRLERRISWLAYFSVYVVPLLMYCALGMDSIPIVSALVSKALDSFKLSMSTWFALAMLSGLPVSGILNLFQRTLLRKASRLSSRRNCHAARLESKPPILLLRSFFEGALARHGRIQNPYSEYGSLTRGESVIKSIEKDLGEFGRPVAIGKSLHEAPERGDHEVIFIEAPDAHWHTAFMTIARQSRFILLLPGWTPGVIREMETIMKEDLWRRTFVYMPPAPKNSPDAKLIKKAWSRARKFCAARGMLLPEHDDRGMLYVPNRDFSVHYSTLLITGDEWALSTAISLAVSELLGRLDGDYGTIADVIEMIEAELGLKLS